MEMVENREHFQNRFKKLLENIALSEQLYGGGRKQGALSEPI